MSFHYLEVNEEYVWNGAAKEEAAMEEESGSSVKYLSTPFYDPLKIISPPPPTSFLLHFPPSCTFRTSFQSYLKSDTSTFLWNEYSVFSFIFAHLYHFGRGFWMVGYP
jgi:hypothetical protein